MNEDARRSARTQGRYSLDNKYKNKNDNTPPQARLNRSANEAQDQMIHSPLGGSSVNVSSIISTTSRLSYESSVNNSEGMAPRPIQCTNFNKDHFRKWVKLDPAAEKPSLIYYDPNFLSSYEADDYYDIIKSGVKWDQKEQYRDGVTVPVPRLTCWFGPLGYSYGKGILHEANDEWFPPISKLKEKIETYVENKCNLPDCVFNSVLLNYYRDCKDGVAWHSDDEQTMGVSPTIGSISLGETRKFELKRYYGTEAEWRIYLTNGSLLIMSGNTQIDWKHRVPTEYHDRKPRINLTYRNIQNL